MRHVKGNKKLGRKPAHRLSMLRNQVMSLIEHEKITTTEAKAKETRKMAERVIRLASREGDDGVHRRRLVSRVVTNREILKKLFAEIGPKYVRRPGGYTRILKTGRRRGDNAEMCVLELVEGEAAQASGNN